jgi:hypothetical protein
MISQLKFETHKLTQHFLFKLPPSVFLHHNKRRISIHLHKNRHFFYNLKILYLNNNLENNGIWKESKEAVPECNLLLIFSKLNVKNA